MIGNIHKDYQYSARVYRQNALEKQMQDDIKTMVNALMLKGKRRLRVEEAKDVVRADGTRLKVYDAYPSCKSDLKKYCPASRMKWAGYIEEYCEEDKEWHRPYRVLSESELGVYLEVLNLYLGRKIQFPAVL